MTILSKPMLLEVLRRRNLHERAEWADRQLPDAIDVERNAGVLDLLGLDGEALAEALSKSGAAQ
jgi:hypothetical protein